ncbi:MAG TPA: hypothetical protein VG452_00230 [Egibacteraceae bacterium]|nr:hypothetical protein [Actinomycetota bacterium]HWB70618.1 hypothetical protein [Egibacteraceae bacterium]
MTGETVTVKVPSKAGYLAVLRTAVGGFAARDSFTLDQVDDLRLAVEETAVQLLRRSSGDHIVMDVTTTDGGIEVRLIIEVEGDEPVMDQSSFSWTILWALTDDIQVESWPGHATVILRKNRLVIAQREQGE